MLLSFQEIVDGRVTPCTQLCHAHMRYTHKMYRQRLRSNKRYRQRHEVQTEDSRFHSRSHQFFKTIRSPCVLGRVPGKMSLRRVQSKRKLITDYYDGLSEFRTAPAHVRSVVHDLLRSYTSSTATENVRYAYGKLCPNREYLMIHIRSGDTYTGKFSSAGNWEPAKTYSQHAPFPTSY